ncbi:transporter substrate-binding domain-containing protein [Mesorhizobium sp. 1B3]|uniref:transporter substrate-binding domain-containing protein n=1 Tax=Mesorhizobium sp. 1B3 TaxID=3243599 RepID=UPI003D994DAC
MKIVLLLLSLICASLAAPARAEGPSIPVFWDARERLPKPDLAALPRLRFLTTIDFPPFNFLDGNGRLSGFHVDLARAICAELEIQAKCQIQGLPWAELDSALASKQGEAIIAGTAITAQSRARYAFSRPYLRFPARFVTLRAKPLGTPLFEKIGGERIGVIAGSAHERMLRDLFPNAKVVTYSKQEWMYEDLRERKLVGIFGDGMRLGFWLAGTDSAGCCIFADGPYLSAEYLGNGLAIAASSENPELADAFDYALQQISTKGVFAELYLRYFPVGFF